MHRDRRKGLLISIAGVAVLSPDSLLVRLIDADPWTLAVWRGVLMGLAMLGLVGLHYRGRLLRRLRATGRAGVMAAAGVATSNLCFINALAGTGVADTLVIIAAAPLIAAFLSRFVLGEAVARRTWIAAGAVVAGLALLLSGDLSGSLGGDLWAFGAAAGVAVYLVAARAAAHLDMVPAVAVGDLAGGLVAIPLAPTFALPLDGIGWTLIDGALVLPLSFTLITIGPRYLRAAEVGLVMLLESVLGPLWVWLALGEVPSRETLAGGAVILATLAAHEIAGRNGRATKREPRP